MSLKKNLCILSINICYNMTRVMTMGNICHRIVLLNAHRLVRLLSIYDMLELKRRIFKLNGLEIRIMKMKYMQCKFSGFEIGDDLFQVENH